VRHIGIGETSVASLVTRRPLTRACSALSLASVSLAGDMRTAREHRELHEIYLRERAEEETGR